MVGFYYEMLAEKERLEKDVRKFTRLLEGMPEGELRVHKEGNYYKWYKKIPSKDPEKKHNGIRKLIPKTNRDLAERLALKGYYQHSITDARRELEAINKYLAKHDKSGGWVERYLDRNLGIKELLHSRYAIENEKIEEWAKAPYIKYKGFPEKLTVPTMAGHNVRSKSEESITDMLFLNKIPYHYEEEIELSNGSIEHPDFIVRHPRTGKMYIWEHLGMVDEPGYLTKNLNKIKAYIESGYIPGKNLILTWETKDTPIDVNYVKAIIDYYFLRY